MCSKHLVDYGTEESEDARFGCCYVGWVTNARHTGNVTRIQPGQIPVDYDEPKAKRQKMLLGKNEEHNCCSRSGNMVGVSYSQHGNAPNIKRCEMGCYWLVNPDTAIDWDESIIGGVLLNKGPSIAMVKLLVPAAIQSCFKDRAIEWERVAPSISNLAAYCCIQSNEAYVIMLESRIFWLQRNNTGGWAKLHKNGHIEMVC